MSTAGDTVRIGLIGLGQWGINYLHTIAAVPGVRLTRVAVARRDAARPGVGAPIGYDWRALVEDEDVDAVVIATPPRLHAEMAKECIRNRKPALVEKPLTMDFDSARDILRLAERVASTILVNHIHLYSSAWSRFKSLVRDAGRIQRIDADAGRWGPFRADVPVLWDWGPHDLAMCLDLLSVLPTRIEAQRAESRKTADGQGETVRMELEFPDSVTAVVTVGNIYQTKLRRFTVFTESAALTYDDATVAKIRVMPKSADVKEGASSLELCSSEPPLNLAVAELANCTRGKTVDLANLRLAVDVVACLAQADRQLALSQST